MFAVGVYGQKEEVVDLPTLYMCVREKENV